MRYSASLLLSALFLGEQAAATGGSFGWNQAPKFNCPANTDNECSDTQKGGYDWSGLNPGNFNTYGGCNFSGFQCSNRFGKRDVLTKRSFQDKCITGTLSRNGGSGPSISGDDGQKGFSITQFQMSSSRDVDVDCIYEMEDGSTCKQTASCKSGGSIIANNQCGGAKSVTFQLPKHEDDDCEIGIHSVGFDCSPPSSTVPPRTRSTPPVISSVPLPPASIVQPSSVPVNPVSSAPGEESKPAPPSHRIPPTSRPGRESRPLPTPISSTPVGPVVVSSVSVPPSSVLLTTSTILSTSTITITSCADTVTNCPAESTVLTTQIITIGTTVCPVTETETPIPVVTPTFGPVSLPSVPAPSPSVPALPQLPPADCPDVLPRCISTWIFQTGCDGNDDKDCYCKQSGFTEAVQECLSARGESDADIQQALSYLAGICVDYIPQNPGIITNCPSQPGPTPSVPLSSEASAVVPSSLPAPPSGTTVTEVIVTSVTTCPVGETVTSNGVPTVLSTPFVSTVFLTTTSTIPCTLCAAQPTGSSAPSITAAPVNTGTPNIPVTTVIISTTVVVPCTYSTGVSAGFTIPASSTTTTLQTTVTVPQVQFITTTLTQAGATNAVQVGLGAGPSVPAAAPPGPTTFVPLITPTGGVNTVVVPKPTSSATFSVFQGAGARIGSRSSFGAAVGGLLAFLIL